MKYKAVIFDYDQTIADSKKGIYELFKLVGKKYYNLEIQDTSIDNLWGQPSQELIAGLFESSDTYENALSNYMKEREIFEVNLFEGVLDLINDLVSETEVGILTSSQRNLIMMDLNRFGFPTDKLFIIQTSDDTQVHKPDPKVFEPTFAKLNELNISKSDTVYIGDSIIDFIASQEAGINFIAMMEGSEHRREFEEVGATKAHNYKELRELLFV